jgi:drug/metabolite transporter (DMT)-like permease
MAVSLSRAPRWPAAREWRATAVVGLLLLLGGNGLVTLAETSVSSGMAAVLVATGPLWMTLLDRAFFRGPTLTPLVGLGLASGFVGVVLLVGPTGGEVRAVPPLGGLTVVVASLFWATGSLLSRRLSLPASPLLSTGMQMTIAGAAMIVLGGAIGEWQRVDVHAISGRSALAFFYLATFGSVIALNAYQYLLRHVSAVAVGTYAFVNPLIAVILGWAILGETLGTTAGVATTLIVGAVVAIHRSRATRRTPTSSPPLDPVAVRTGSVEVPSTSC